MTSYKDVSEKDLRPLLSQGFYLDEAKTPQEVIRLKGPATLILYQNGRLLVQGNPVLLKAVEGQLEELGLEPAEKESAEKRYMDKKGIIIGSDESLKGDTFGGLVVAAVKCDDNTRLELMQNGVTDSKRIADERIPDLARIIKKRCRYHIRDLPPEEYNKHNMTILLNRLHSECVNALLPADKIVIDKYPGCDLPATLLPRAELEYVEVAAASILAREAAIAQFERMSEELGFEVPKGSSHVEDALRRLIEKRAPFNRFVKMHFMNVKEAIRRYGEEA